MTAEVLPQMDPILAHSGPWTEEEYLALPTNEQQRVELIDGELIVSPLGDYPHQELVTALSSQLRLVLPRGLYPYAGGNVRAGAGRLLIPDVVVSRRRLKDLVANAADVALVGEVVSPSSRSIDRILKPALFAKAGIGWYLRIEQRPELQLILHRLRDDCYVERAQAGLGQRLDLPDFGCAIEVDALLYDD